MKWETIKNFGKVKYFNISYAVIIIVPIIANILDHYNDNSNKHVYLPSTVKAVYVASLIYAIAIAIYQYACSSIIKDYDNYEDYLHKNLDIYLNLAADLKLYVVLANLLETQEQTRNEIIALRKKVLEAKSEEELVKANNNLNSKLDQVYTGTVQNNLRKKHDAANTQNKAWIWVCGILYIIGTGIIVVLLVIRTFLVFNN